MARLTAAARRALPAGEFALPGKLVAAKGGKKKQTAGAYPVPDKKHAALAKGMVARFGSPAAKKTVDAKANRVLGKPRAASAPKGNRTTAPTHKAAMGKSAGGY